MLYRAESAERALSTHVSKFSTHALDEAGSRLQTTHKLAQGQQFLGRSKPFLVGKLLCERDRLSQPRASFLISVAGRCGGEGDLNEQATLLAREASAACTFEVWLQKLPGDLVDDVY